MTEEVRARHVATRLRKSKINAERKSPPAGMIRRGPVTSHQSCGSHWRVSEHGPGKGSRNGSGVRSEWVARLCALCAGLMCQTAEATGANEKAEKRGRGQWQGIGAAVAVCQVFR